jgi:hypothetical protein
LQHQYVPEQHENYGTGRITSVFIHDQKRAITTMMAKRGPKGGEMLSGPAPMKAEEVMDEDRMPDGRHAAAQDMIAAFHEKSPEKLMQAMMNFHDIHQAMSRGEDGSDE